MITLKAFRGAATFEQKFNSMDEYQAKLEVLLDNGWTIGSYAPAFLKATGVH